MPALVVLDTNALLLPFERRVRIEEELVRLLGPFQGLVPEPCLKELARIASEERGARRDRAKMALSFSARFKAIPATGSADEASIRIAKEHHAYLFTMDRAVIKRAHALDVPIIRLKGLSHLVLETSEGEERAD